MSLNISIKNAEKEMLDIMEALEEEQDDKIIFDSFETLNTQILKLIKEKDNKWITKFFKVVKNDLITLLEEKKDITLRDIRTYLEDKYESIEKRQLIDYIVDLICIHNDKFSNKKNKKDIDHDDIIDNIDENEDPVINIPLEEIIKFDGFRNNQTKAIDNTILQNYISGVHDQIMGAGKTYIMLKSISNHYNEYKQNLNYEDKDMLIMFKQNIVLFWLSLTNDKKEELINLINKINPDFIHLEEIPEYFLPNEISDLIYTNNRNYKIFETSHDSSFEPEKRKIYVYTWEEPEKVAYVGLTCDVEGRHKKHIKCNSDKGNKTAYDFMKSKSKKVFEAYIDRINALYKNKIIS